MMNKDGKRKKKVNKTKRNYWFDIMLTGALALTFVSADLFLLHQGLAFLLAAGILLHLVWHWAWIKSITMRFFGKLPSRTRWLYVANVLLLGTFFLTMFTGMALSPTFVATPLFFMEGLHEAASAMFLGSIGVHLFLHVKWIWSSTKRYLLQGRERGLAERLGPVVATGRGMVAGVV
ncbi:MAG TPA: hypothetical protein VLL52_22420, partial [Anaerolineae bacterium]|nr:hypothetical protein [Anaerolineae bacterium]